MKRVGIPMLAGAILLALSILSALGQPRSLKDELVGSWKTVSATDNYTDGHSANNWGKLRGMLTFDRAGNFTQILIGDPDPQMRTKDPRKPDAPEVAYFGTYTVDGKVISLKLTSASYSPRDGSSQTWTVSGSGDTLTLVGSQRKDQHGEFSPTLNLKRAE